MDEHQQWVIANRQLDLYLALCAHLPGYNQDHSLLLEAVQRDDLQLFRRRLVTRIWLAVCHLLAPDFADRYGSPHLYWDYATGELRDIWEPIVKLFMNGKLT